ncbi:MAG: hypothetical protein IPI38_18880 [Gemmatimonadetes bacterium]|nr:hypothetical protein [Gemmatimonadota bacterium]MBP6669680.1 hypothetical protein [Gemmatimonadales bacterium]MBK6782224.1 hypothetical protein [Gemmatimonadota bacterium]MBK7351949.1 hypothetical protein [Gemmatimonadota bacterium]MBK7717439.1 hypothetical protein [Gemmatimonadota bacterium]
MKSLRLLTLALTCALLPGRLAGQAVLDDPTLDSVQTVLRDALYRLRDTLTLVDAATARIARDLRATSDPVLRSRARAVADRCSAAVRMVPVTRETLSTHPRPAPDPRRVREGMDRALVTLEAELKGCVTEFTRLSEHGQEAELRGYGIGRGTKVRTAVRAFQPAAESYFGSALGIRYRPKTDGSIPTPSATGS